jgi:putative hydrolase of the HAD superfamily
MVYKFRKENKEEPERKFRIKAVLLDIDNTMIPTSSFAKIARTCAIDSLLLGGLQVDREVLMEKLNHIIKKYGSNYPGHFDILLEELHVPKPLRSKLVAKAVIAYHNAKQILLPYPDVPATLYELKRRGHKLYAVSEGISKKQWEKLIRSNIDNILDGAFMTEDYNIQKQPEFYEIILNKIKVHAKQCVMVGDRVEKDIIPAKSIGIHTVRVLTGAYKDRTSNVDADYKIKKFSEILKILPLLEKKLSKGV